MNTAEILDRFNRDGFVVIDRFFEDGTMDTLDELIRGHFGEDPDFSHEEEFLDKAQTEVIPWFPQNEGVAAFDRIDHEGG